jgi:hypothetical protein
MAIFRENLLLGVRFMPIKRASARSKGRNGELEILARLSNIIREEYVRRGWPIPEHGVLQTGPNGKDIVGLNWLAPEVKRHEDCRSCKIDSWWLQTKQNSKGAIPVLFWRPNNSRWTVRMFGKIELHGGGCVRAPVDIDIDTFILWFQVELKSRFDALQKSA